MPIDRKFIGRSYGPFRYTAGAEKMREFAFAVGGTIPSSSFTTLGAPEGLHPYLYDEEVAQASPHGSLVAMPSFAVTFAMAPFGRACTDPELGVNLLMLVHGEQEFEWFDVIRPGDVLTTTGTITDLLHKAGKDFLTLVSESVNQRGTLVVRGVWTAVIRGE